MIKSLLDVDSSTFLLSRAVSHRFTITPFQPANKASSSGSLWFQSEHFNV